MLFAIQLEKGDLSMQKVFLTFGDGAENFVAARKRVAQEAVTTGLFDEVLDCDWKDVSPEMQKSPLRTCKRGCGYWAWKPDLIYSQLLKMDDGDILVYCDSGNVVHRSMRQWKKLFALLDRFDCVFRRISSCGFHWQRKELHECFAREIRPEKMIRMCFNFEGSTVVLKRTPFTLQLVGEWRDFVLKHPKWVRDVEGNELDRQLPGFVENRHDQSVLTLLVYKYLSRDETCRKITSLWEFHQGWWIWGNPAIEIARNRSGSAVRPMYKARCARLLYRILWRIQLRLENAGLQICWAKICGH